ncbi:PREDICTED: uncharacterized protein LOC107348191 isoform X1 [Acropora digitifera]|uniref:uncharacterized protein LOC107348191 isoform X1 n=1 Tax=Acropora digitifera TaxID=70779 RepID=UPI00077A4B13|nr:PREDICTED: uncharacterized protein LOC107348191 isoform X1 [Acropora digitifera]
MSSAGEIVASSTPNVCLLPGDVIENAFQNVQKCSHRMLHPRQRGPISVDDAPLVEALLSVESPESFDKNNNFSGVFLSSWGSSSSSLACYETESGMVSLTPNVSTLSHAPKRRLFSSHEVSSPSIQPLPCLEGHFIEISEDIGSAWKKLGQLLLKRECLLNNIDADFSGVGEKAHQLLLKWKEDNGSAATLQALFKSLLQIKRFDVARKLMKLEPSLRSLCHLLDNVIESGSTLYNHTSSLNPDNLEIVKVLQSSDEKVFLCLESGTSERFVLKQVEDEESSFNVRKCIDCNALKQQSKRLRKTDEFMKDLQMKHKMVTDLIGVIQQLQDHLSTQHQAISEQQFSCSCNCEQYTMKQDLVQKELTLLHHELKRMIGSNRRISISGIPAERIFNLATRTYSVCEEHREMHTQSRNRHSFCQHPEDSSDTDDSEIIQGSLLCVLNVIIVIGRRRKVTQSMKVKQNPGNNKLKLTKSRSNPLSSNQSELSHRHSYSLAQENPVRLPSLHTPGDWSGVPPFKMCSDFKIPAPAAKKADCYNESKSLLTRCSPAPQIHQATNSVILNHRLLSVQWLKGVESDDGPDEIFI